MTWLRIDDGFVEHPKIVDLTDAAFRAHFEALSYCARNLTDGLIPAGVNGRICTTKTRRELVAAGIWIADGDAYRIHDYLDWNPSRADVLANQTNISKVRSDAGKRGARVTNEKRWGTP